MQMLDSKGGGQNFPADDQPRSTGESRTATAPAAATATTDMDDDIPF